MGFVKLDGDCNECQRKTQDRIASMFPYLKKATRFLTEADMVILAGGKPSELVALYNEILDEHEKECDCPDLFRMINERIQMLKKYQDTK